MPVFAFISLMNAPKSKPRCIGSDGHNPNPFMECIALQASQTSLARLENLSLNIRKQPGIVSGLNRFLHKATQVWRTQGVRQNRIRFGD
jgi:hypothetical protein